MEQCTIGPAVQDDHPAQIAGSPATVKVDPEPAQYVEAPTVELPRTRVAIVGKAPSSRLLAPYDDPSWEVWSLSDNYNVIPRWDRWFELHDLDRYKELYPEYYDWMSSLPGPGAPGFKPVYTNQLRDEIPAAVAYPLQQTLDRYGRYFTNTISWQITLAIDVVTEAVRVRVGKDGGDWLTEADYQRAGAAIGLWGVDMAQHGEYAYQRPSCEFFMGWLAGLGIELVVPDECDLLKTSRLYGFEAYHGLMDRKIRVREHELMQRRAKMQHELDQARQATYVHAGAAQELAKVVQVVGGNAELAQMLAQRQQQIEAEANQAAIAAKHLDASINQLKGALEDLKWSKQWA